MAFFSFDMSALIAVVVAVLLIWFAVRGYRKAGPSLFFSDVGDLKKPSRFLSYWIRLPQVFAGLTLLFFLGAFADPHFKIPRKEEESQRPLIPTEGIAIYLALDKSGSMAEEVVFRGLGGGRQTRSKMDVLKEVTAEFIKARSSDMIGVVSFARQADIEAPLTIDRKALQEALKAIDRVSDRNQDGTAIGYAILKTSNLITATRYYARDALKEGRPAYEINDGVIVVVTDGFQDPNPLDYGNSARTIGIEEAAAHALEQGNRLYLVNVDPKLNTRQFAPQRRLMERAAESTGGRFFQAGSGESLQAIYEEINALEVSKIPGRQIVENRYERFSFYPYLIAAGMLFLFLSIFFETTVARRVP